jgi:hypothetical protein
VSSEPGCYSSQSEFFRHLDGEAHLAGNPGKPMETENRRNATLPQNGLARLVKRNISELPRTAHLQQASRRI